MIDEWAHNLLKFIGFNGKLQAMQTASEINASRNFTKVKEKNVFANDSMSTVLTELQTAQVEFPWSITCWNLWFL
jgi:hypothetical protein